MNLLGDQDGEGQSRGPSRRGFYTLGILALVMGGFLLYIRLFRVESVQAKPVEPIRLTTGNGKPIAPPPVEGYAPSPPPKPQAESPRPRAEQARPERPAPPSAEQKMRAEKRLAAHYAAATVPGVGSDGRALGRTRAAVEDDDFPTERRSNPQTLDVPSRYSRAGNGGGNLWTKDFWQRGEGQVGVVQRARSPFVIQRGWTIPARLNDPINTDTPGQITATVIHDIKDSMSGRHLLIPAGSQLVGSYDTRVGDGQNRLPTAWDQLNFPNGDTMPLAALPGADLAGRAGLPIAVDNHLWSRAGRSLLLTITGAAASTATYNSGGDYGFDDAFARESGQQLDRNAEQIWRRGGYRPPTGTAESGEIFLVQVTAPLVFPGAYRDEVDYELE